MNFDSDNNKKIVDVNGRHFCQCPTDRHVRGCPFDIAGYFAEESKSLYNSADFNSAYLGDWNPPYVSHDKAYLPNREQMVARILDTIRNNGIAAGAIEVWVDHLVGSFTPDPMPMADCLGWDEESVAEWCQTILEFMQKYLLDECFIDTAGECNFLQLLQLAARQEMIFGEITATVEWMPKSYSNSPLQTSFNFIDPGRIRTPSEYLGVQEEGPLGRSVRDGFLKDCFGKKHGAYVFKDVCDDWLEDNDEHKFVYMKGKNETFHRNLLIHEFKKEYAGQTRGVSKFAPILEGMQMHKQLMREINLSAQFRNKVMGVFKSTRSSSEISKDMGMNQTYANGPHGGAAPSSPIGGSSYIDDNDKRFKGLSPDAKQFAKRRVHHQMSKTEEAMDGVRMIHAWPNEEMELFQPNNGSIAATALTTEMRHDHAAGTSIPTNMLTRDSSSGTYSGLRTARLDFFAAVKAAKPRIDDIANCMLRHAMDEAIAKGIVKFPKKVRALIKRKGLKPHQYYAQNIPTIMSTYWMGPPEKLIDPNREIIGYQNGEKFGYLNPSDIVGRTTSTVYKTHLERRKRDLRQKIDAEVACDEYETRRRIEANNRMIAEGLYTTEGNSELNNNFNQNNPNLTTNTNGRNDANGANTLTVKSENEPLQVKEDKNKETPLQNIIQSENGTPLDTSSFILGEEDQIVPERGRPQLGFVQNKILNKNNKIDTNIDIPDHVIEKIAETVIEKLEPLMQKDSQSNSNYNPDADY